VASSPEPFLRLPLTYDRAFGGRAWGEDFGTASGDNPHGKGFVLLPERIEGSALPNIEEQDQLLTDPMQRPLPAGLAPLPRQSTIRLARGAVADPEEGTTRLLPGMFSMAHPRMMLDAYPAGATFQVRGMTPSGSWSFRLPDLRLHVCIDLGDRSHLLRVAVDTLCVFPDYSRFFLVARRALVYQLSPRRRRAITLREGLASAPAKTLGQALADAESGRSFLPRDEPLIPFELLRELNPLTDILESLPFCPSG
jgi:hypothetical protein